MRKKVIIAGDELEYIVEENPQKYRVFGGRKRFTFGRKYTALSYQKPAGFFGDVVKVLNDHGEIELVPVKKFKLLTRHNAIDYIFGASFGSSEEED